jgi:hypothetical protein
MRDLLDQEQRLDGLRGRGVQVMAALGERVSLDLARVVKHGVLQ